MNIPSDFIRQLVIPETVQTDMLNADRNGYLISEQKGTYFIFDTDGDLVTAFTPLPGKEPHRTLMFYRYTRPVPSAGE